MTATKTCNNVYFKRLLQRHVIMSTLNDFKRLLQRHVIMSTLNDCYKDM